MLGLKLNHVSKRGHCYHFSHYFQYVFDYQEGDVFGCVADIGWITGHSYVVYGPLSNGATTVLFESTPTYPDPGEFVYTLFKAVQLWYSQYSPKFPQYKPP